jgi:hypothetical protein
MAIQPPYTAKNYYYAHNPSGAPWLPHPQRSSIAHHQYATQTQRDWLNWPGTPFLLPEAQAQEANLNWKVVSA